MMRGHRGLRKVWPYSRFASTSGIRDETVARLLDGDRTVRMTMEQMWKLEGIAKLREEPV